MKQINQIIFDIFRTLIIDEFISPHQTDITCMEDDRLIISRVITHAMNGAGHVTFAPQIDVQPKSVTYYAAGHVDVTVEQVTVEKLFKHDIYQVTIDTPYLNVVAMVDEYGNYQVDLKVLDGKGNIKQNKLFQGNQIVPISFKVYKTKFVFKVPSC